MAFGSLASSNVKIILQAEDNVTKVLGALKSKIRATDAELKKMSLDSANSNMAKMLKDWDAKHKSPYDKYHVVPGSHVFEALKRQTSMLDPVIRGFATALDATRRGIHKATKYLVKNWDGWASKFDFGGKLATTGAGFTAAGAGALRLLYKPLSDYGDFQRNMLEAQVKSGASAAQYNAMTGAARQYAANSSWDPQQVSSVMAKMSSMGFKPDQITNSFRQIMDYSRAVGQDDPMWAAQGIGAMMNSFGINAADRAGVSKVIDKMTAAIVNSPLRDDTLREAMKQVAPLVKDKQGTIDDMLAWNMVMAQKGIDGSIAGTAQKNFLMRTGNSKIVDYLGKFGIAVFDDAGNRRSARQILADIAQIKKVMTDKEWDAFAFKVFGARSQSGIGAMFDDDALEQAYSALADAGGLSEQIREQMESGVFGSLKRIWSALQDMFLEVGKSLENLLKRWEPEIIAWFHYISDFVANNPAFLEGITEFWKYVTEIGAAFTVVGSIVTAIGGTMTGISGVTMALAMIINNIIAPLAKGIWMAVTGIAATCGVMVAALVVVAAILGIIIGKTFRWGKIFQAMLNGGSIAKGFSFLGQSLWLSLRWASLKFFELITWILDRVLWGIKKILTLGMGKGWDYSDSALGQAATAMEQEYDRDYRAYLRNVDRYSKDALKDENAVDVEKRGKPVAMPTPMNDDLVMIQRQQREAMANEKWAIYFPGTQRPAELEQAEKEIEKYEKAEEKRRRALVDAALESDKSAEKEEKAAAKKKESERKKAVTEARAEERRKAEEERKAKEFKANQLKRQAEITKGMKPLFQGTVEATKWLHGLGEYSKGAKEEREEEMADNVAGIYDILSSGEGVVFAGV